MEMRIYIASLADYNNGTLHGEWIDIDESSDRDDILDEIETMLENSPINLDSNPLTIAEEWAIHDLDFERSDEFGIGEFTSLDELIQLASIPDDKIDQYLFLQDYYGTHSDYHDAIIDNLDFIYVFSDKDDMVSWYLGIDYIYIEDAHTRSLVDKLFQYVSNDSVINDIECEYHTTRLSDGTYLVYTGN